LLHISAFLYSIVGIVGRNRIKRSFFHIYLSVAKKKSWKIETTRSEEICVHPFNPRHLRAKNNAPSGRNYADLLQAFPVRNRQIAPESTAIRRLPCNRLQKNFS
jgi:hypothetical protein